MQSLLSRILCASLSAVFHSPLINNSSFSDNAGKKTKDKKSHYKPSKEFIYSTHVCGETKYEKLIMKNSNSQKVILLIHGGSFKVKLIDMYRKLAEKYSKMLADES